MQEKPINDVLAANLQHFMEHRGLNQPALAKLSGVKQTTISLYLAPARRLEGKSGKPSSAKLTEVAMLAEALRIEPWELVRNLTAEERDAYSKIEEAFRMLHPKKTHPPKRNGEDRKAA